MEPVGEKARQRTAEDEAITKAMKWGFAMEPQSAHAGKKLS